MITGQHQLRVLQVNLRHSKSASIHLSQVILDLDLDLLLIQEPYAFLSPSGDIIVGNIPPGYVSFHNLSNDHAFGAVILAKTSLNATAAHFADSNHCCCVRVSPNLLFFFNLLSAFNAVYSGLFLFHSSFDSAQSQAFFYLWLRCERKKQILEQPTYR